MLKLHAANPVPDWRRKPFMRWLIRGRRSSRQRLAAGAMAGLILLLVSACGGAPSAEPTPAANPTAVSTPGSTAIAPENTPVGYAAATTGSTAIQSATATPTPANRTTGSVNEGEAETARQRFQRLLSASWSTDFSRTSIDFDEIMTGGPPKDGIPAIDQPVFESVGDADGWLEDLEPVQVVDIGGDVRAYPVQIMVWHEIVNDTVGGEPVVITF